jgi:hypothetical protein
MLFELSLFDFILSDYTVEQMSPHQLVCMTRSSLKFTTGIENDARYTYVHNMCWFGQSVLTYVGTHCDKQQQDKLQKNSFIQSFANKSFCGQTIFKTIGQTLLHQF